jgi:hypothetical protein
MGPEERDSNGRFAPGNSGGPGRPKRATEAEYYAAFIEGVSLEDWREVVARAVTDAKAGDPKARAWLSKHLIGDHPPDNLLPDEPQQMVIVSVDDWYGKSTAELVALAKSPERAKELAELESRLGLTGEHRSSANGATATNE